MKDQQDCVLNDLGELGGTELFPEESAQYCYFFLCPPPPVILLFHFSSDQWWQNTKWSWRLSFYSPDFNRSIIVSRYTSMTKKKMNQFLRHWIIGGRIISWFNIGPSSFSNWYSSCGWASRIVSLWFCFGLHSACKITCIQFLRTFFELHSWGFLLVVVLVLVVQVRDQFAQAMRNSDTWVRIVFVHRLNYDFHSILTL